MINYSMSWEKTHFRQSIEWWWRGDILDLFEMMKPKWLRGITCRKIVGDYVGAELWSQTWDLFWVNWGNLGGFLGLFVRHCCMLQITFLSPISAFLTFFSDFNITETCIQTNFDSETHDLLSWTICPFLFVNMSFWLFFLSIFWLYMLSYSFFPDFPLCPQRPQSRS